MSDKTIEKFEFKAGDVLHLDKIYAAQGLAGGDWWSFVNDNPLSDTVIIWQSIKITVTSVRTKSKL